MNNNFLAQRTPEELSEALRQAGRVRAERAQLIADFHDGKISLDDLFQRVDNDDPIAGRIRVRTILMAHPGVGTITANKVLEELKISAKRRLRGVGHIQRDKLIQWSAGRRGEK